MTTPALVDAFYSRIWNSGDEQAVQALLAPEFDFRGSLGTSTHGHAGFLEYVRSVRARLAHYHCEILAWARRPSRG